MSTPNFRQPELSKIYTLQYDENDEFSYEDEKNNIIDNLLKIRGFRANNPQESEWIGNNRFILGSFHFEVFDQINKAWEYIKIPITIESGYYGGAMIDASLKEADDYEISATNQLKIDKKIKQVENILEKICYPIVRIAVFSNGEAIYERA
jgi:hypothetical protein